MREKPFCCRNANRMDCMLCFDEIAEMTGVAGKLTNVRIGEYDFDTCQIFPNWMKLILIHANRSRAFSLGATIFGSGDTLLGHPRAEN